MLVLLWGRRGSLPTDAEVLRRKHQDDLNECQCQVHAMTGGQSCVLRRWCVSCSSHEAALDEEFEGDTLHGFRCRLEAGGYHLCF